MAIVGRLAPSPTGSLHVGNVRTFLWAWLSARGQGGRVLLRVEDLDQPRVKPGVVEEMINDLAWLGFDWDGPVEVQGRRREFYLSEFDRIRPHAYPCGCTRAELAMSAPHEGDAEPRYPGTCRTREIDVAVAWRLRVPQGPVEFDDLLSGRHSIDVQGTVGDFVIAKRPDQPAYQLAVVLDDVDQGVTEVVRGDDLIPSTARQLHVYRVLGATPPVYGHVPLVVGPDGKRLAKRHGDARIRSLRDRGVPAHRIVEALARWSNLPERGTPRELVGSWDWSRVPKERVVLTPERLAQLV